MDLAMSSRIRKGNLSSTPSLLSIASSADLSFKEETLPHPSTLAECDEQLETYQILLHEKSKDKARLIDQFRELRAGKEPLFKIKSAIQEEISAANHVINAKSEEVTHLKQKLRHHSEKQIQVNIERLEVQLRNNNYKPREEQKILDEIYMLKRSVKTLKEFELKQKENKKYRSERSRLIDQRNEVFSKVQAIILQEEEIKREITELKHIISATTKTADHLKTIRPELERTQLEALRQKEAARHKKHKDRVKARKEQSLLRQEERRKRWEEYEASRDPYQEEKDSCKRLLSYLQSALPSLTPSPVPPCPPPSPLGPPPSSPPGPTPSSPSPSSSSLTVPLVEGSFYSKPKAEPAKSPRGKKNRSKKKEQKAVKVRELSHPPDVLENLCLLKVVIPRTTEDVLACVEAVEAKLRHFGDLGRREARSPTSPPKDATPTPPPSPNPLPPSAPPPFQSELSCPKSFFSIPVPAITCPSRNEDAPSHAPTPTYASVAAQIRV